MTRLPLSVIGGYLGAGKTTLINALLSADHGLRLAVLVNDFGAINIDAALLRSADEDTIELTNGCVCCMMTGDLFFAIGDLLDRNPRPDHIIIEASGIADPAKIANVALAEPDLRYAGIVTVVDGMNIGGQLANSQISGQIETQLRGADLLALSKSDEEFLPMLRSMGLARCVNTDALEVIMAFLFDSTDNLSAPNPGTTVHPGYVTWSDPAPPSMSRADVSARLAHAPPGLLRFKGMLPSDDGGFWEAHIVGVQIDIRHRMKADMLGVVGIGLAEQLSQDTIAAWWARGL